MKRQPNEMSLRSISFSLVFRSGAAPNEVFKFEGAAQPRLTSGGVVVAEVSKLLLAELP
jgi:hypothetical protein